MTSDDHLPGEKYLPGLDGDPTAAIPENWTSAEFDDWFNEHVAPSELWTDRVADSLKDYDDYRALAGAVTGRTGSEFETALDAFAKQLFFFGLEIGNASSLSSPLDEPRPAFSRLGIESKLAFFRGWLETVSYHERSDGESDATQGLTDDASLTVAADDALTDTSGWHRAWEGFETTTTLPDGSVVTGSSDGSESRVAARQLTDAQGNVARQLPVDIEPAEQSAVPTQSESSTSGLLGASFAGGGVRILGLVVPRSVLAVVSGATLVAVIAVIGLSMLGGGGAEGESRGGSGEGGSSDSSGGSSPAGSGGSSGGMSAATSVCEAAHERQEIVQLSSPDVQPSIPRVTYIGNVDAGFPSPRFEWSEMPSETTEIAVLVQSLRPDRAPGYEQDAQLWWRQEPVGVIVWLVTGIDASARSLSVTSLTSPLPGEAVEHQHENGRINGYDQQFWIQQDDRPHLFTVFALCDPPLDGTANDYSPYWLRQNAVSVGWFFSSREQ